MKDWFRGSPAAFDLTVTSLLCPTTISEAGVIAGSAAAVAELRKHNSNGSKCSELGWKCVPLAVESYGAWGREAQECLTRLASHLAIRNSDSKARVLSGLYGRLNLTLMQSNARALLARLGNLLPDIQSSVNFGNISDNSFG